ncbi:Nup98 [Symbiodinium sp. KB8]|nr:Nup98 [Symbiodinium sp. KB8]
MLRPSSTTPPSRLGLYSFLCRPQDQPDPASTEQRIAETTDKPQVENSTPRPVVDHSKLIVEPDLSQMSSEELAEVYDLTVTKPDIGSVVFHGVTDCRDLDIAQTVVLKRGYVLVYPDPAKKPPPGEGLNKHATVTMYQCFPPGLCRIPMDSADFLVVPKLSEKTQHVA